MKTLRLRMKIAGPKNVLLLKHLFLLDSSCRAQKNRRLSSHPLEHPYVSGSFFFDL